MLDFDTCNAARLRRDPSFDGVFFTAVRTTGIYCRPVCPVKQPLTKNVSYYPSAAAAEQAGYRPCLRCRPETAPFCPAWNGTRTTVERAVRMIEEGALDKGSVEGLAGRLGIGGRHLGRLFQRHLGMPPYEYLLNARVNRAETALKAGQRPVEAALVSGFADQSHMTRMFRRYRRISPGAFQKEVRIVQE